MARRLQINPCNVTRWKSYGCCGTLPAGRGQILLPCASGLKPAGRPHHARSLRHSIVGSLRLHWQGTFVVAWRTEEKSRINLQINLEMLQVAIDVGQDLKE
jgi:hypothetical protein